METFLRASEPGQWWFPDPLWVLWDEDGRVTVENEHGNVMFAGSRWLFDKCWERGYFRDAES